jgi:hypothetical protein
LGIYLKKQGEEHMNKVAKTIFAICLAFGCSAAFGANFDCKQHYDKKGKTGAKKCNQSPSGTPANDSLGACAVIKTKCGKLPKAWGSLVKVTCSPIGSGGAETKCP